MPALEEPIVRMETYSDDDPAPVKPSAEEGAIAAAATVKAAKAPSSKAKKPHGPRRPSSHPPYAEMIKEAILTLKERTGSSPYAIAKVMEDKHKAHLPANFRKMLLLQLKKLAAAGKLTRVKSSYKLSSATSAVVVVTAKAAPKKPATVALKAKYKARPVAPIAKPKSKTVAKSKSKAKTVTKPKPVAVKPKSGTKRNALKPAARQAKSTKISAKDAPGKRAVKAPAKSAAVSKKASVKKPKTNSTTAKKSKK